MKELEFIKIIKDITSTEYIGDDCAYLKELGIVITQDNFVEDVHFKKKWSTPYQIGYKATAVNISDILAAGAKPKYLSIGLSLPKDIDEQFIEEFYRGVLAGSYGAKITGGDITGADKIFISITAIGTTKGRKISSRNSAKVGDIVIISGKHGLSTAGLNELITDGNNKELIQVHLEHKLDIKFSEQISKNIQRNYAMMDTSDGLADALFKIAQASKVTIQGKLVEGMFGAEDFKLVACVPKETLQYLDNYIEIGNVANFNGAFLEIDNKKFFNYDELDVYDHFGE